MAVANGQRGTEVDGHAVHFYRDGAELAKTVGARLRGGLGRGGIAVVIATPPHARAFVTELERADVDVDEAVDAGRLILRDAHATLAELIVDGRISREAFDRHVGGQLRMAISGGADVQAYGEMVDLLWQAGDIPAALELEGLWNELVAELGFQLLCGYRSELVTAPEHRDRLREICHLHSEVSSAAGAAIDLHEVSRRFEPEELAPAVARRFAVEVLQRWGHPDTRIEDARLVLSELVANAVIHARSPMSVSIRSERHTVRLAVHDDSPIEPTPRPVDPSALSGRGLQIVGALSSSWGVDATPVGKTVWAEL